MAFFDNDRWRGSFPLERNARYQFTIEAWRDDWATWLGELAKKRGAGLDVRLETIEGVRIAEKAGADADEEDAAALRALMARLTGAKRRFGGAARASARARQRGAHRP